ncbi:hypothetical protein QJR28_09570 [Clostridium baratii]|uniref:hypothetical protein n=1 Tax=Clostridium baratii TaxID=1561 RepID=UPI0030CE3EED
MIEIVKFLEKGLGEIIRIGGALGNKEETLEEIHIQDNNLYINNNTINLKEYNNIKLLDEKLISFRDDINEELIVILLKNKTREI